MYKKTVTYDIIRVRNFGGVIMKKGKIKYWVKNESSVTEFNGECTYYDDKNIILYNEEDKTRVILDLNNNLFSRENDEMILVLDFNGKDSHVEMKNLQKTLPLDLDVDELRKEYNTFRVKYKLSKDNNFEFYLEWNIEGE